jgi:hypothetical protein
MSGNSFVGKRLQSGLARVDAVPQFEGVDDARRRGNALRTLRTCSPSIRMWEGQRTQILEPLPLGVVAVVDLVAPPGRLDDADGPQVALKPVLGQAPHRRSHQLRHRAGDAAAARQRSSRALTPPGRSARRAFAQRTPVPRPPPRRSSTHRGAERGQAEVIPAAPMFGDLRLSNPSGIDVPDGEVRAGGFATHHRPRVATAHGHALDDPVARGETGVRIANEARPEGPPRTCFRLRSANQPSRALAFEKSSEAQVSERPRAQQCRALR